MSCEKFYRDAYLGLEEGQGYDPVNEPTFESRVGNALKLMGESSRRVLDFGCGSGAAGRRFLQAGHRVAGVDVSESAIRVARRDVAQGEFAVLGPDRRIPYPDRSFDVCFCSEVLEHLLDVSEAVREMKRILAPGGLLLVTVPYHGWIKNLIVITIGFEKHFDPRSGHVRFFSKRSIRRCLEAEGFRVAAVHGLGRFWPVWRSMFVVAHRAG